MQQATRTTVNKDPRKSREERPEEKQQSAQDQPKEHPPSPRRIATVYDAVAGRVGLNGFLKPSQLQSASSSSNFSTQLRPEEVLLRRVNAPDKIPYDYYDADHKLDPVAQKLPDSELLKDIHGYVSEYYEATTIDKDASGVRHDDGTDFKSFDETAILAMGILLEEACKEALGENGDMVFSEPVSYGMGLPRSSMSRHQVIGRVVPDVVEEYRESESSDEDNEQEQEEARPRKRARRRYGNPDAL